LGRWAGTSARGSCRNAARGPCTRSRGASGGPSWAHSLKHGINFEIVIRTTGETVDTITVTYNQNVVYSEIDGVLKGYSPNLMWERHLEDLFSFAQKKEKELSKKQEIEDKIHKDHKKIALLNKLKLIWGF
jgi:hypothetical protein